MDLLTRRPSTFIIIVEVAMQWLWAVDYLYVADLDFLILFLVYADDGVVVVVGISQSKRSNFQYDF